MYVYDTSISNQLYKINELCYKNNNSKCSLRNASLWLYFYCKRVTWGHQNIDICMDGWLLQQEYSVLYLSTIPNLNIISTFNVQTTELYVMHIGHIWNMHNAGLKNMCVLLAQKYLRDWRVMYVNIYNSDLRIVFSSSVWIHIM